MLIFIFTPIPIVIVDTIFALDHQKQINLALNYCFNKNLFLKCTSIISKHSHSDVELHLLLVTGL